MLPSLSLISCDTTFIAILLLDWVSLLAAFWCKEQSCVSNSKFTILLHFSQTTLISFIIFSIRLDGLVNVSVVESCWHKQPGQLNEGDTASKVQQLLHKSVLHGKSSLEPFNALLQKQQVTFATHLLSAIWERVKCGVAAAADLICDCNNVGWPVEHLF